MIGMYKRNLSLLLLILLGMPAILAAPRVLSLDSCRTLAVENNKDLRKSEMEMKAAYYNRKSAFTNYLPKVFASGIYMHTGKELSLLSDEQKATIVKCRGRTFNSGPQSGGAGIGGCVTNRHA